MRTITILLFLFIICSGISIVLMLFWRMLMLIWLGITTLGSLLKELLIAGLAKIIVQPGDYEQDTY